MREREDTIAFDMSYCQHYDPQPGQIKVNCTAGMDIAKVRLPRNGDVFGQPCIRGHLLPDPRAICPHWIRRTREMGEARADAIEQSMRRMRLVGPVVAEWRKKPPRGKSEMIECPACHGKLHLSQAASNGHVWGQCETEGCVSWIE